jgi:hypothetical protein
LTTVKAHVAGGPRACCFPPARIKENQHGIQHPPRSLVLKAARAAIALGVAFAGGWVAANTGFATSINPGLVRALNVVGQDLFGSAAFGAKLIPGNPVIPTEPHRVQLDLASDSQIATALHIVGPPIIPNAACRVMARLAVTPQGVAVSIDQSVPGAPQVVYGSLAGLVPALAGCPQGVVDSPAQ